MSLIPLTLDVIGSILKNLEKTGCPSRRLLSLGYPDILANDEHIRGIFGGDVPRQIKYRDDSEQILRWHGAERAVRHVPDAVSLFTALGYELDVLDIAVARGGEIVQDLNQPIPENLKGRYALVLDAGTLEHCFNIGAAARNVAEMIAHGGAVMHGNPINMYNHGSYNLNPTWYHDFYEENGFVIEFLRLVDSGIEPKVTELPSFQRFASIPDNCTILVVARRAELQEIRWPIQRKYRDNPNLRG